MSVAHRFDTALDAFLALLPAVRDGNAEAIHDARVATRRLRAMIPLLGGSDRGDQWPKAERTLRRAGRALGKARDVDVSLALAAEVEARVPVFAPPIAAVRTDLQHQQLRTRRRLIKRLEELRFERLLQLYRHSGRQTIGDHMLAGPLVEQAAVVGRAIERATGLYFAKRAHTARVQIKKLRYLVEMSAGCEAQCKGLKLLKSAQESLGRIHDREVLLHYLRRSDGDSSAQAATDALAEMLEAEIRTFYEKFLRRRAEVGLLCMAIYRWAVSLRASRRRRRMLSVGVAALPSAAVVILARRAAS